MKYSMRAEWSAARQAATSASESSRASTICEKPAFSRNAAFSGVRMSHCVEAWSSMSGSGPAMRPMS